jgi:hypothetical protein
MHEQVELLHSRQKVPESASAHLLLARADFGQLLVPYVHEHDTAVLASADQQAVVVADMQPCDWALVAFDLIKLPCRKQATKRHMYQTHCS